MSPLNKLLLALLTVTTIHFQTFAQENDRFEVGIGAGSTHALAQDRFKQAATSGDAQTYWLGYSLEKNWALELAYDVFDFDGVNTKHKAISLGGVYRFYADHWIHPVVKLGLGTFESKNSLDEKTNSFGAKAAGGLEADFKYLSVGTLVNYFFMSKAGEADSFKDAQAFSPVLFLSIHNEFDSENKSVSTAPQAVAETPTPPTSKKDSDGDGVSDQDDKCPNTPVGTVVNQYGCSEKEKASVKLNVSFAFGQSTLDPKYNSEIESLANFMKKFSDTKVEVGGYTDDRGSVETNTTLSQKRAEAVKDALVKSGVAASRLMAKGYGPANPVADNKTALGRSQNRRVIAEISVITDKKK